jgi:redox-sensitive bicupin YhaK (pirin superfamily)
MSDAIELMIAPRERDIGGLTVRRILPHAERRMIGPFIFFDHMGPVDLPPGKGIDVRPHPHIGLATVTYLFTGSMIHRDSLEYVQKITPGAVNWMTAGRGIVHSERTGPEERSTDENLHGIQSWVALPLADEEIEPSFRHHPSGSIPTLDDDGVRMRLIAGSAFGETSPVATCSPMFYLEVDLPAGKSVAMPSDHEQRAVYVVDGIVTAAGTSVAHGQMAVLNDHTDVTIRADVPTKVMLLGGAPMDGTRHIWWNFVASSQDRIEKAKDDWVKRRFDDIPGETEFILLPES